MREENIQPLASGIQGKGPERREAALQFIGDLVAFDTTAERPTAPLIDYVEKYLKRCGAICKKKTLNDGRHAVLVARIGPNAPGGIVLAGHIDVVSVADQTWRTDPFRLHNDGGRLYGRGTCDMKGFVGCVLAMVPFWQQARLEKPFYLALTCDEEGPNATVKDVISLLQEEKNKPAYVVVGEPTGMEIVTAHKGSVGYFVEIVGKAVHSSQPDRGVNALLVAHDVMTFVRELDAEWKQTSRDERFSPPYATINIGQVIGGTAPNIVAARCVLVWHLRHILRAQAAEAQERFNALLEELSGTRYPGVTITFQKDELVPLESKPDNPAVGLAQRALGAANTITVAYATEAGCYQQAGFSTVVCGPGSIDQAHAPDEFLSISQIDQCLSFLKALSA